MILHTESDGWKTLFAFKSQRSSSLNLNLVTAGNGQVWVILVMSLKYTQQPKLYVETGASKCIAQSKAGNRTCFRLLDSRTGRLITKWDCWKIIVLSVFFSEIDRKLVKSAKPQRWRQFSRPEPKMQKSFFSGKKIIVYFFLQDEHILQIAETACFQPNLQKQVKMCFPKNK